MKTRPATDEDITYEYDGPPNKVLVSSFYRLFDYCGTNWLRPRKRRGIWVVQKFGCDRPLLVRVEEDDEHPGFVVNASDDSVSHPPLQPRRYSKIKRTTRHADGTYSIRMTTEEASLIWNCLRDGRSIYKHDFPGISAFLWEAMREFDIGSHVVALHPDKFEKYKNKKARPSSPERNSDD